MAKPTCKQRRGCGIASHLRHTCFPILTALRVRCSLVSRVSDNHFLTTSSHRVAVACTRLNVKSTSIKTCKAIPGWGGHERKGKFAVGSPPKAGSGSRPAFPDCKASWRAPNQWLSDLVWRILRIATSTRLLRALGCYCQGGEGTAGINNLESKVNQNNQTLMLRTLENINQFVWLVFVMFTQG